MSSGTNPKNRTARSETASREAVVGPALVEDQDAVEVGGRTTGAQVLDAMPVRQALKSSALRVVRISQPGPPSWSEVDLHVLVGALTIGADGGV
jgi:hypothetical protein